MQVLTLKFIFRSKDVMRKMNTTSVLKYLHRCPLNHLDVLLLFSFIYSVEKYDFLYNKLYSFLLSSDSRFFSVENFNSVYFLVYCDKMIKVGSPISRDFSVLKIGKYIKCMISHQYQCYIVCVLT